MKNVLRKFSLFSALLPLSAVPLSRSFAQTLPVPDHVVLIIFENHGYSSVMNASRAPHMMSWSTDTNTAVFTNLKGMTHPSQPNYLWLFAGSNFGIVDNDVPTPLNAPNLAASLYATSKTFATYSEDLPSVGFNGSGSGSYARKHNPVANWMGTGTNKVPDTTNKPMTMFPDAANYASLPTISFVVPNEDNDMHNGNYFTTITTADAWTYDHLDSFRVWAMTHNSLLVITYDEDEGLSGNRIATMFIGPMVKGGNYNNPETLVNILGTFESMYGLPRAGAPFPAGITDTPITYCWRTVPDTTTAPVAVHAVAANNEFSLAPNPASDMITFNCSVPLSSIATISIIGFNGRNAGTYPMSGTSAAVNTTAYTPGIYYYRISDVTGVLSEGKFVIQSH